jgi:hypothetical protein
MYTPEIHSIDRLLGPCQSGFNSSQSAVVDLVFERRELSRENMEIFIAPQGIKADALVDLPPNSHSEHLS